MKTNERSRLSSLMLRSTTKPWLYNCPVSHGRHKQVCCPPVFCRDWTAGVSLFRWWCILSMWKCSPKLMNGNLFENCTAVSQHNKTGHAQGSVCFVLPSFDVNLGIVLQSSWNLLGKWEEFSPSSMFSVIRKQNLTAAFEEAGLSFCEGDISFLETAA